MLYGEVDNVLKTFLIISATGLDFLGRLFSVKAADGGGPVLVQCPLHSSVAFIIYERKDSSLVLASLKKGDFRLFLDFEGCMFPNSSAYGIESKLSIHLNGIVFQLKPRCFVLSMAFWSSHQGVCAGFKFQHRAINVVSTSFDTWLTGFFIADSVLFNWNLFNFFQFDSDLQMIIKRNRILSQNTRLNILEYWQSHFRKLGIYQLDSEFKDTKKGQTEILLFALPVKL